MEIFIGNKWESSKHSFDVINPFTGDVVDSVPIAAKHQIDRALEFCHNYRCDLTGLERSKILERAIGIIQKEKLDIAKLITKEVGLSLKSSTYEVERSINCLSVAIHQAQLIDEIDITDDFISDKNAKIPKLRVVSEPLNLAIGITPFNHPLNMLMHKLAPAIAAGTPMVCKPSEHTPLTAIKLIQIFLEAGLPPGMVNIVTGIPPKDIVDPLVGSSLIDVVSFTGGVSAGKYIARQMVNNGNELKKYMPELGGNVSIVIMDDCNLDRATDIGLGAFDNSGQRCTAVRKILLHNTIATNFIDNFVEKVKLLKYGDPMSADTDIGTVITIEQAKLIEKRVNQSISEGSKLLIGNHRDGAVYSPTIVDHVNPSSELAKEETFGPVLSIIRIDSLVEAIHLINSDPYGLASAIVTENIENTKTLFENICVGQFSWNGKPSYRTEEAPFGGFKDSGNGEKEGVILMTRAMRRIRTFYEHRI